MAQGAAYLSAAWVGLHWPAVLSAADHARHAASSAFPMKFEYFTPEEAKEVEAITARVIPTDDTPGAREAGVVYFIDKGLVTFAKRNQKLYRDGLADVQSRVKEMYSKVENFSAATADEQDAILTSFDHSHPSGQRPFRSPAKAPDFFETIRQHTILGFLIDPDSGREGNRDAIGWKAIGREPGHTFQPPFGFYDKNYPGWQPDPRTTDKQ